MSNWTVTVDGLVVFERTRLQAEDDGRKWIHEDKIIDALFSRRFVPVEKLRAIAWRETSRRNDIEKRVAELQAAQNFRGKRGRVFEKRSRKRDGGTSLLDWRMSDADDLIFEQIRRQLVEAIRVGETAIDFSVVIPWLAYQEEPRRYRFSALLETPEARSLDHVDETTKRLFTVYTNGGEWS